MKMLKANNYLSLLLLLPLLFTGCKWNKKKEVKETKHTKRVALHDKNHGFSIIRESREGGEKNRSRELDAFIIKDKEDELLVSSSSVSYKDNVSHSDAGWVRDRDSQKEFEPVLFAFDSAAIRKTEESKLDYDIAHAKEAVEAGYTIVVEGHADGKYVSPEYNVAKSEQRAKVGAEALKKSGIPQERVKVVAYGDNKKAVPTNAAEERNRRIEFVKVSHGGDNVITL